MGKTVQIRNLPDRLHRTLKSHAARPTVEEMLARLQTLPPVTTTDPVDALREARKKGYSGGD